MSVESTASPGVGLRGLRVLIVDDDEALLSNLAAFLEQRDYVVFRAESYDAAQQAMERQGVDVAVVDYRLGNESGINLIRSMRRRRPQFPVVLMSAYLDSWVETLVRAHGPVGYLAKPFSGEQLIESISEAVEEVGR